MDAKRRAHGRPLGKSTEDRSGVGFPAAICFEDHVPNRLLRTEVPVTGAQQRETPAFSIHGVLPGGKRHVHPSVATFPNGEADQLEPVERACIGFEDQLRVGKFPRGLPLSFGMIRTDTTSPLPLDIGSSM